MKTFVARDKIRHKTFYATFNILYGWQWYSTEQYTQNPLLRSIKQWLQERTTMLRSTYSAYLFFFF